MYKNVASQKLAVFAMDTSSGPPYSGKTGDAANITAEISKDGGTSAATNDANPTELDAVDHPGIYLFDLTQAETNADLVLFTAKSSTGNVVFDPIAIFTLPAFPANFPSMGIESDGHVHADLKELLGSAAAAGGLQGGAGAVIVDTIASGFTETSTTLKGGGTATLSAQDDAYNGRVLLLTSGTYAGAAREISDYDGTTKVITLATALPGVPADSDGFLIL